MAAFRARRLVWSADVLDVSVHDPRRCLRGLAAPREHHVAFEGQRPGAAPPRCPGPPGLTTAGPFLGLFPGLTSRCWRPRGGISGATSMTVAVDFPPWPWLSRLHAPLGLCWSAPWLDCCSMLGRAQFGGGVGDRAHHPLQPVRSMEHSFLPGRLGLVQGLLGLLRAWQRRARRSPRRPECPCPRPRRS